MKHVSPEGNGTDPNHLGGTLGSLFRAAREARGIPIEQAAHETRIRVAKLREMEADDLSQLSPAYARMFVRDYARYLGLNEEQIEQVLPESGKFGIEGYQYIQNAPGQGPRIRPTVAPRRSLKRTVATAAVLCVFFLAVWQGWMIWRKLEAIQSSAAVAEDMNLLSTPLPTEEQKSEKDLDIEWFRAVGESEGSEEASHNRVTL